MVTRDLQGSKSVQGKEGHAPGKKKARLPIVPGDDNSTGPGLFAFLDEVELVQTFSLIGGLQSLGELVVADTARVDDGVGGKHVLRSIKNIKILRPANKL